MKVSIIAALTADGFIARGDDHLSTQWTSAEDKKFFREFTREAGTMVTGYNSFATYGKALPGRRNIVYTHRQIDVDGVETTCESPAELIARLESEGVKHLAVCGGAQVYTLFMQSGLVTDLFLNYHSVVFGAGKTLFNDDVSQSIRLVDSVALGDSVVCVHFEVEKEA